MAVYRPKILLVDDEPANLLALEAILADMGELVTAGSGREALRRLLEDDFAVILLDVKMPGMDGFETAEFIRKRERTRHVPIIFVTAFREEEYQRRSYFSGASDLVYKPIVPEILRSKVAVFVELRRKTAELERSIAELQRAQAELRRLNVELERRVEERTAELKRSNEDLQQFVYAASHDLQEPLRMVASYVQLLARRYRDKLDGEAVEFIDYASDGARRMQALIEDLLAYSRAATAAPDLDRSTDASDALAIALRNLDLSIRETGAEITATPLPRVRIDRTALVQVFQNLVGNAMKYRREAAPRIEVSAAARDGTCEFGVRDNGIGIDPRHLEQIFGIFKRLHGRGKYPGNGVGLAICKRIIERNGGRIWAESKPGEGSTFRFTLPAAAEARNAA